MPKHPTEALTSAMLALAVVVSGCGEQAAPAPEPAPAVSTGDHAAKYEYDTVGTNPDVVLPDGFRGDVHPLLDGDARLEVVARWKPTLKEGKRGGIKLGIIDNAKAPEYSIPDEIVALLTETTPVRERATWGAHELSAFLPQEVTGTGQMWRIDPAAAVPLLAQFHPGVTTTFDRYEQSYGRRPGPAGAFGIVRAVSSDWLDVLFRVHAEFVLREGSVLYTPACFLGRMLVDREAGTVEWLELHVPTDLGVNVDITVTFPLPNRPKKEVTNIVFEKVELMELAGGDGERLARIDWQDELDVAAAHRRLTSAFYKFMDIAWVPPEQVLELSRAAKKPAMVVVLTSPLDDQSC
jgi:hypothetical protein